MALSLLQACRDGKIDEFKAIIEQSPQLLNAVIDPTCGGTALRTAARWGQVELVRHLLQLPNIDVNKQDNRGDTALHRAAALGNREIVLHILKHPKIITSIENNFGDTPSDAADSEIIRDLFSMSRKELEQIVIEKSNELLPVTISDPVSAANTASALNTTTMSNILSSSGTNEHDNTVTNSPFTVFKIANEPIAAYAIETVRPCEIPVPAVDALSTRSMTLKSELITEDSDSWDCFLSHNWGDDELGRDNHSRVVAIAQQLNDRGITTWLDENEMIGNIRSTMATAIKRSKLVLVFITKKYSAKISKNSKQDNCFYELDWASKCHPDDLLPVVMEPGMRNQEAWCERLSAEMGNLMYSDCSGGEPSIEGLVQEIQKKLRIINSRK